MAQTHQAASGKRQHGSQYAIRWGLGYPNVTRLTPCPGVTRWVLFGNRAAGNVGEETVYTKHQNLPQTSKHYKQSSLHSSVLVIVGVPFGVLSFRGFILVRRPQLPWLHPCGARVRPSGRFFDCWWALFGNRAAEINNEGDSVY